MSDLHWACEHCGHHLAIDEKGVGRQVVCKSCGKQGAVPPVGSQWFCTECRHKVGAALNLVGKTVHCDECGAEQTVPNPGKSTGAIKIDLSTFSKHARSGSSSVTTVICPECGARLPVGATICPHCMHNLSGSLPPTDGSGAAKTPQAPRVSPAASPEEKTDWKERAKIAGLVLVILFFGARLMGDRIAFWRRASPATPILAMEHYEYVRVFEYLETLRISMDMGQTFEHAFSLARFASRDLSHLAADPERAGSMVLQEVTEAISILDDYRRLWAAAQAGTRVRGREASDMAQRHPELAGLLQGSGASATLDPQEAIRDMEITARMAIRRGIDALAR